MVVSKVKVETEEICEVVESKRQWIMKLGFPKERFFTEATIMVAKHCNKSYERNNKKLNQDTVWHDWCYIFQNA